MFCLLYPYLEEARFTKLKLLQSPLFALNYVSFNEPLTLKHQEINGCFKWQNLAGSCSWFLGLSWQWFSIIIQILISKQNIKYIAGMNIITHKVNFISKSCIIVSLKITTLNVSIKLFTVKCTLTRYTGCPNRNQAMYVILQTFPFYFGTRTRIAYIYQTKLSSKWLKLVQLWRMKQEVRPK